MVREKTATAQMDTSCREWSVVMEKTGPYDTKASRMLQGQSEIIQRIRQMMLMER